MEYIFIAIVWIALVAITAVLGSKKKIGGAGAGAIAFFLSPIIGLLVVAASNPSDEVEMERAELASVFDFYKIGMLHRNAGRFEQADEYLDAAYTQVQFSNNKALKAHFESKLAGYINEIRTELELV